MHPEDAEAWEWDEGNESELSAHNIVVAEVYEVWMNRPVFAPNRKHRAGDWKMCGLTDGGRRLTIVLRVAADRRSVRPITGWDATAGERARYF
ncbi:MAG: hypothetical protein ACRDZ7_12915 [Acidimicrobiia bacterium]